MVVHNLPYEFCDSLIKPGLDCDAGVVPLNQYMSGSISNGGSDNAISLFRALRWMREGGKGAELNKIVGAVELDLMIKGQGDPASFIMAWDFMCRNQERLSAIKLSVVRRPKSNRNQVDTLKTGNVYDLYFRDNRDSIALSMMIKDGFFGIDCIGFVANYLIFVGEWDKYYGFEIPQWDRVFTRNISESADVRPCQILLWPGHIAIVDWVHCVHGDKVTVDVCQSSSGGPQCNERVTLTKTTTLTTKKYQLFKLEGEVPVAGYVYIMARDGFRHEKS